MTKFVDLLINGLSLGFVYGLIALGFVIVFKATRVVNFAHSALLFLGAYVVGRTHASFGFVPALLFGMAVTGLVAVAVQVFLLRKARRQDHALLAILTLGVDIVIATELIRQLGINQYYPGDPWGTKTITLGSSTIPEARIAAAVVAIVIIILFALAFRFSGWGVAMRSASEDAVAAALMGIRLGRVAAGAWLVAGVLAAIAGVFFTTFPSQGVTNTTELSALAAIPAAVIGGLDSTLGAVAGGLIVGLASTFAAGYQDEIAFLGRGIGDVVPFAVMLIVLLIRPSGLFGTKELTRV